MASGFDKHLFRAVLSAKGIQIFSQSITVWFLITLASEKSLGQFDYYLVLVSSLANIALWGQDSAVARRVIGKESTGHIVSNSAAIQFVQACATLLACVFVLRYIAEPLGSASLSWLILLLIVPSYISTLLTENILNICRWTGRNRAFIFSTFVSSVVPVVALCAVLVAGRDHGYMLIMAHGFARLFAVSIILAVLVKNRLQSARDILFNQSWLTQRELLSYSIPMGTAGFLLVVVPLIERLVIYSHLALDGLAVWSIGGRAMVVTDAICGSMAATLFQTLHIKERSGSVHIRLKAIRRYLAVASLATGITWIVFLILAGLDVAGLNRYVAAIYILVPLGISSIINGVTVVLSSRLSVQGSGGKLLILGILFSSIYIAGLTCVDWKGALAYPACLYMISSLLRLIGTLHFVRE